MLFPFKLYASLSHMLCKIIATIVILMKCMVRKESVITGGTQKEVLIENTLIITLGNSK